MFNEVYMEYGFKGDSVKRLPDSVDNSTHTCWGLNKMTILCDFGATRHFVSDRSGRDIRLPGW